jgi:hypothetical protein
MSAVFKKKYKKPKLIPIPIAYPLEKNWAAKAIEKSMLPSKGTMQFLKTLKTYKSGKRK